MKKFLGIVIILTITLTLTGCGSKETINENSKQKSELVKTCTSTSTTSDYKMENEYKVYGSGKTVDSVITIETVTSDDDDILDYLEEYVDKTYSEMNENYGGYTYKIDRKDNKIVATTTIDYNKMDLDKYVSDNSIMKNYVNKDNKLLIDGIVSLHKTMGATCK